MMRDQASSSSASLNDDYKVSIDQSETHAASYSSRRQRVKPETLESLLIVFVVFVMGYVFGEKGCQYISVRTESAAVVVTGLAIVG